MEELKTESQAASELLRNELRELGGKLKTVQRLQIGSLIILIAVIIITWLFPHFRFGGGGMPLPPQVP